MAKTLNVGEIAELALQRIGAFPPSMSAADPVEVDRAVRHMDMVVCEIAGIEGCFWLRPATLTATLTADTPSFDMRTLFASGYPTDGVLFVKEAYIRDSSGNDEPARLIARDEYEAITDKDESGVPEVIYIDRLKDTEDVFVHPVPTDSTYSLRLVVQIYSPSYINGQALQSGNIAHGLPDEWQRWLVLATAAEIGDGPVRRLPIGEVDRLLAKAGASKERLIAYTQREKTSGPPRVAPYGV